jgi:hypothetical protein
MSDPCEAFLGYYYFGFHAALTRYRVLTPGGWAVAAVGAAGLLVAWREGADLFTFIVALAGAAGGLSLVHQSVAALDAYVRVPFPRPEPGTCPDDIARGIDECARLMEEIDRGGWHEARAAFRALDEMAKRFSFPPLP